MTKSTVLLQSEKQTVQTQIEARYLVWETSVQGKNNTDLVKRSSNKAAYFAGSTDKGAFTKKVNAFLCCS